MPCPVCLDLGGLWVETRAGVVIEPCPSCGRQHDSTTRDPSRFALELARQVAADHPDAPHDDMARLIYERLQRVRLVVDRTYY